MKTKLIGAIAAVAVVAGAGMARAEGNLNIFNWGNYTNPDLIKKFEETYDVKVTITDYDSNDTALTKQTNETPKTNRSETMNTLTKLIAAATLIIGMATSSAQAGLFSLSPLLTGAPSVTATVSISQQRMLLTVVDRKGATQNYVWKVSTGKTGFETPTGSYKPYRLSIDHKSKTYNNAPMPFAVFFHEGYAIHATDAVDRLGNTASHGCVRLSKENAAMFFDLVEASGMWKTKIVIVD